MNRTIFIFQNRFHNQYVVLGVDSVALRHTLVYVWETLQVMLSNHSSSVVVLCVRMPGKHVATPP